MFVIIYCMVRIKWYTTYWSLKVFVGIAFAIFDLKLYRRNLEAFSHLMSSGQQGYEVSALCKINREMKKMHLGHPSHVLALMK